MSDFEMTSFAAWVVAPFVDERAIFLDKIPIVPSTTPKNTHIRGKKIILKFWFQLLPKYFTEYAGPSKAEL